MPTTSKDGVLLLHYEGINWRPYNFKRNVSLHSVRDPNDYKVMVELSGIAPELLHCECSIILLEHNPIFTFAHRTVGRYVMQTHCQAHNCVCRGPRTHLCLTHNS